jgi:hypothetical protein
MAKKKSKEIDPHSIDVEFDGKIYPFSVYRAFVFDKDKGEGFQALCAVGKGEMREGLQMTVPIQQMFGCRTLDQLKHLCWCGLRNQRVDWERELALRQQEKFGTPSKEPMTQTQQ